MLFDTHGVISIVSPSTKLARHSSDITEENHTSLIEPVLLDGHARLRTHRESCKYCLDHNRIGLSFLKKCRLRTQRCSFLATHLIEKKVNVEIKAYID